MIQTLDTRTATPVSGPLEPPREALRPPVEQAGPSRAGLPAQETHDIGPYRVILLCSSQSNT